MEYRSLPNLTKKVLFKTATADFSHAFVPCQTTYKIFSEKLELDISVLLRFLVSNIDLDTVSSSCKQFDYKPLHCKWLHPEEGSCLIRKH
jgi:hypothetical protein